MAEIVDLRGRERVPTRAPVLADPSGRRARLLARAGRAAAAALLLWIAGLALAGLGVLPAGDVPFGHAIAGPAPPALRHIPRAAAPTAADLRPAVPLAPERSARGAIAAVNDGAPPTLRPRVGARRTPATRHGAGSGGTRATYPGHPATGAGGAAVGAGTAPATGQSTAPATGSPAGAATTTPARIAAPGQSTKQTAPGRTSTTAPGNSAVAPGQVKQTTTTTTVTTSAPGQSGSAPGQTATHGSAGHGHNN